MAGQQPVRPLGMVHGNSAIPVSAPRHPTRRLCGRRFQSGFIEQIRTDALTFMQRQSTLLITTEWLAPEEGPKLTELSRRGAPACSLGWPGYPEF